MKQFSTILNIILLVAVGVLFYLHFSSSPTVKKSTVDSSSTRHIDSCLGAPVIAFVDLDSLNTNVDFIKTKKKELEADQNEIANEYQNAYKQMESEKNNFLKRGNAITQSEAEEFQGKLMQKQQQVETTKQLKTQKLAQRSAEIMEDMQSNLKKFLNEYNKDGKFTYILATGTGLDYVLYKDSTKNITTDVVKGLNDLMNKKGKQ